MITSLEQAIERAAEVLPDGYAVILQVEKGAGWVELERGDMSRVKMGWGETDLVEQVMDAISLAFDEVEAVKLWPGNTEGKH